MKLYGTTTSPYVRRVRIVAAELGEPIELVNTAGDAGQAVLRELSPIRKVPVAKVRDEAEGTLFDSHAIIDWLFAKHGPGPFAAREARAEGNRMNAIDAALDSIIQLFYLRRDGVAIEGSAFERRQLERTDAIFAWLGTQLAADRASFGDGLGRSEIWLVCALDWMDLRRAYPTERAAALAGVRKALADRPSLAATRPHE